MGRKSRERKARAESLPVEPPAPPVEVPQTVEPVNLRAIAIVLLLVMAASAAVYANTLFNQLVYDDLLIIGNSTRVRNPWDLKEVWGYPGWLPDRTSNIYRPIGVWSIALNYRLNEWLGGHGSDAPGYHAVNLGLHALASAALAFLLLRLPIPRWTALAASLIFAVHPIHTEAVASPVGRAEVLAFLFGILMLIVHRERGPVWISAPLLLLAVWSKESAMAFLVLAPALDLVFPNPKKQWPWAAYAGYGVAAAFWLAIWRTVLGDAARPEPFIDNPTVGTATILRLLTAANVQLEYLRLHVFPWPQSSDYSFNQMPIVASVTWRVGLFLAIFAVSCGLAWRWRRKYPEVTFGVAAYAILFGVTSNFVLPIGTIMGERLAYAPSLGVCLILGCAIQKLHDAAGSRPAAGALAVLLLVFGIAAVRRNETWATEKRFFETQLQTAPRSAKAHFNMGFTHAKYGDDAAAIREYEESVKILPFYPEPLYYMGQALVRTKADPEKVIAAFKGAIQYDQGHREARAALAGYYLDLRRPADAKTMIDDLAKVDPKFPTLEFLRARLGQMQAQGGQNIPFELQQGILAYANNNFPVAIELIEKSVNAGVVPPNLKKAMFVVLSKSYEAVGKPDRAKTYKQLADATGPM